MMAWNVLPSESTVRMIMTSLIRRTPRLFLSHNLAAIAA